MEKTRKVLSSIFVSMVLILAILLVGVRLIGLSPYTVLSGSMSPKFPVGAMIYVKPVNFENVRVGDPITFYLDGNSATATHRVIKIDELERCFYTKGDANETADGAPVAADNLIGTPVFCIPVLGYVGSFVSTPPGLYIMISLVLIYVLLSIMFALLKKTENQDGERKPDQRVALGCSRHHLRDSLSMKSKDLI